MAINSYQDLEVWKYGIRLSRECYLLTKGYPKAELFGLTSQIRRAAVSVPANIAEGYGRGSSGDYVRFLKIARGSLKEVETLLIVSSEVELVTVEKQAPIMATCESIGKMLNALIRSLGG